MKWIFSLAISCLMISNAFSGQYMTSIDVIKQTVNQYYDLEELIHNEKSPPYDCLPDTGSCFITACENVSRFECDDPREIDNLRRACRGNWGDSCLKTGMSLLHRFEYDENAEMAQLANSCRGVFDTACINYTCQRLGTFGCDDLREVIAVNRACSGDF